MSRPEGGRPRPSVSTPLGAWNRDRPGTFFIWGGPIPHHAPAATGGPLKSLVVRLGFLLSCPPAWPTKHCVRRRLRGAAFEGRLHGLRAVLVV
jgi:hypothetical protein